MCQFSSTAERTRKAEQGEKLTVTESPHGAISWVTAPGCPDVAVCLMPGTILAVETDASPGVVRGARFEQDPDVPDHQADSIVYLDGREERMLLYRLWLGTKVQVLQLPVQQEDDFATAMAVDAASQKDPALVVAG